ncbi:MAG: lipid A biosynthesis lauroyl acyltransferase [Pseudomonadota bacterium]
MSAVYNVNSLPMRTAPDTATAPSRRERLRDAVLRGLIALLRAIARLPLPVLARTGRGLGRLLHSVLPRRVAIARTNIRLCFPELDEAEVRTLARRHFIGLGQGIMEALWGWWGRHDTLPEYRIDGLEHLQAAQADGRGVLLYTGHFNASELGTFFLTLHAPISAIYRPNDLPPVDEAINAGRLRHVRALYPKDQPLAMVRALREGAALWIAPDQSFEGKQSAFLPFFGIRCATNTATPQLARMGHARILPFFVARGEDGLSYHLTLLPPVEGLPSGDDSADTQALNALLEAHIRRVPDQYLWGHRRFKDLPDGQPSPY